MTNKDKKANDVKCMQQKTVKKVSKTYDERVNKTDIGKMSMVDSRIATKIDFRSVADKKEASKTHGKNVLKKSIQQPKIF